MSENPLVADVKPLVSEEDGIKVADFGLDAWNAIGREDWCEAGVNAAAATADTVDALTDPFGTLLESAFAWMMEHVAPLPEMLDTLAGDPDVVQANAHTWANVSDALRKAADDMMRTVKTDTAPWHGPAMDVYKPFARGEASMIDAAGTAAGAVGAAVSGAGIAVQTVRTIVRDLIAEAMSELVQYLARSAIAAGVTLGLATPVLVADGIRIVAKWSTRVAEWLRKIVRSFQKLAEIVQKVKPALSKVDEALQPAKNVVGTVKQGTDKLDPNLLIAGSVTGTYDEQNYYKDATGKEV